MFEIFLEKVNVLSLFQNMLTLREETTAFREAKDREHKGKNRKKE